MSSININSEELRIDSSSLLSLNIEPIPITIINAGGYSGSSNILVDNSNFAIAYYSDSKFLEFTIPSSRSIVNFRIRAITEYRVDSGSNYFYNGILKLYYWNGFEYVLHNSFTNYFENNNLYFHFFYNGGLANRFMIELATANEDYPNEGASLIYYLEASAVNKLADPQNWVGVLVLANPSINDINCATDGSNYSLTVSVTNNDTVTATISVSFNSNMSSPYTTILGGGNTTTIEILGVSDPRNNTYTLYGQASAAGYTSSSIISFTDTVPGLCALQ
jgi:hypothetical protein